MHLCVSSNCIVPKKQGKTESKDKLHTLVSVQCCLICISLRPSFYIHHSFFLETSADVFCSFFYCILSYWFVQFSSVAQSCPTLCDPMNHSTPGLPVHQQLLEFTQTHVHQVGDAIQPSHPLSSPSPPAPNPSQHQGLFQWVNSSHEVAKVLDFSFSISPSNEHPGLISICRSSLFLVLIIN